MGRLFDSLFGDIYNNSTFHVRNQAPTRPLWTTLLQEDDDATREHLWGLYRAYYESHWNRIERMRLNLCSYVGLNYFGDDVKFRALEGMKPEYIGNTPKVTTALIQAMVNQQVTQSLITTSEIAVTAIGTDFSNTLQAEAVKEILDAYERRFDEARNRELVNRRARIMGEAFRHIYWNKDKGPVDPAWKRLKEKYGSVKICLENGDEVECRRPVYQGDLDEDVLQTWDVGLDNKTFLGNCEHAFIRYLRPVDEIRVDYPDMDEDIEATTDAYNWSTDMMATIPIRDHALCVDFYFRSTPYLPFGYYARITPTCILEQGPNPYRDVQGSQLGNIPLERLTDLDVDGSLHGWSRIQNLQQGQNQYDNTTTMIARNIHIGAHPKWMMPKGAANITRLANKATVVQYAGPTAPQLVSFNTVPGEVFSYRQSVKEDMEYVSGSNAIARGEAPKGVTASAALQFLDQQATESNTLNQKKGDQHQVAVASKRLAVISQFFTDDDERFVKVLGRDQSWYTKIFDVESLGNDMEIGLMVSDDLPKRKDARMQTVFQMSQIWPSLYPPEAIAGMFKLGHVQKFLSGAAAAYQAAELENWQASHSENLADPTVFENMIVHWRTHARQMYMAEFRRWPKKAQKELEEHMLATEYLMLVKMRKNQIYGAQLQQLGDWPLILPLPDDFGRQGGPPVAMPSPPPEQGQGGAQQSGDADLNQQRFPDGKFGGAKQAIAA